MLSGTERAGTGQRISDGGKRGAAQVLQRAEALEGAASERRDLVEVEVPFTRASRRGAHASACTHRYHARTRGWIKKARRRQERPHPSLQDLVRGVPAYRA